MLDLCSLIDRLFDVWNGIAYHCVILLLLCCAQFEIGISIKFGHNIEE
ncbi:unnamed protein product [Brugia timori]|uniref:Uncharacterized protein n=1 Tax=Brugia timori TaxID=42155 RepID=A0A0R3Q8I4_9BILA|nr:unnamed protein product [Brugia timori]